MRAGLANRFGEQPVSVLKMLHGVRRRKAPILAFGRKGVGRGADPAAVRIELPVRPQIGAKTIGGERQIVIQPDLQSALPGIPLGGGELQIQLPLNVFVKQHAAPVRLGKLERFGRSGIPIRKRPRRPVPDLRIGLMQALIEGRMQRELIQQAAFFVDVGLKLRRTIGAAVYFLNKKVQEKYLEKLEFQTARCARTQRIEMRGARRFPAGWWRI